MFRFRTEPSPGKMSPLSFTDNAGYWRAVFERDESYFRKATDDADQELSFVHRSDWWEKYPGVGAIVWSNLETGLSRAYAGEWDLGQVQIRGRCLPYDFGR